MSERGTHFVRVAGNEMWQARVDESDLRLVREFLADPPGGLDESSNAKAAIDAIDRAIQRSAEMQRASSFTDAESDGIHWVLERVMAANLPLSSDLHDFRDVVRPH